MNDAGRHIDRYLDRLLLELRGSARDVRRILAETEEHLRDATQEGVDAGLPEEEAQRRAVERFGAPRTVARRFGRVVPPPRDVVRGVVRAVVPFTAIGLIAVGVSGVICEILGRAFGAAFVAGDLPWVRYTPARCADFREYFPGRDCLDAAALHHWGEVVDYRVAAGVLGLLVLAVHSLITRRRAEPAEVVLPAGLPATIGLTLYGAAAVLLLGEGANATLAGGASGGAGQWMSAGAVALAVALAYGRSACRALLAAT